MEVWKLETLVIWIIIIFFFFVISVGAFFIFQYKQIKDLKLKINSLVEVVEVPKEKEIRIDIELVERKILSGTDSDLTKYAQKLYGANDMKSISNNFEKLALLDKKTLEYGLIRVSALEESSDLSKVLPPLVVFLLAVLTSYSSFFQEIFLKSYPILQVVFPTVITIGSFLYIATIIGDSRREKISIIYLKGLLQYAKEMQKES